jgi:2-C-methyl-D-erythritol 4-phosphate cytidylyltransferase
MNQSKQPSVYAILAAAGAGTRLAQSSGSKPKQFLQLRGKPLYQWSLLQLCKHPEIKLTVIATLEAMAPTIRSEAEQLGIGDKVLVITGGATRQISVSRGLSAISEIAPPPEMVIVHDAARPFLSTELIDEVIRTVRRDGACTACIAASDTIKRRNGERIAETLDRDSLVLVQTPQAAKFEWLVAAHEQGQQLNLTATDDAALLEAAGYPVSTARGSKLNLKVTEPEDLVLAEAIANVLAFDGQED